MVNGEVEGGCCWRRWWPRTRPWGGRIGAVAGKVAPGYGVRLIPYRKASLDVDGAEAGSVFPRSSAKSV